MSYSFVLKSSTKAMKIIFRDKEYETLTRCYEDNRDIAKISLPTFINRVRTGDSIEDALSKPKGKTLISHLGSHMVEGVEYENLPSIARAYGIKEMTVYKRYHRGCRGDDLVPPVLRKNYVPPPPPEVKIPARQLEIGGVTYKNIKAACRALGVKFHTYKNRRRTGCTLEVCLNLEPYKDRRKTRARIFEYKGEQLTFKDIEQRFGIYYSTFLGRLEKGLSVEEALAKKSPRKNKLTRLEGD